MEIYSLSQNLLNTCQLFIRVISSKVQYNNCQILSKEIFLCVVEKYYLKVFFEILH